MLYCKGHVIFLLLIILMLWGCNKSTENPVAPSTTTLTQAEWQQIIASRDTIAATADSILDAPNPIQGFTQKVSYYKSLPGVSDAWVTDQALFVSFTKGGTISWNIGYTEIIPPWAGASSLQKEKKLLSPSEFVGNKNALIVNQQSNDESRQYVRLVVSSITTMFDTTGYTVTVKNGSDANFSYMAAHLKDFGAVFYISHGLDDGTHTWILTGEEGTLNGLMNSYSNNFIKDEISIGEVKEKRQGNIVNVTYYMFSEKLLSDFYMQGDLPHSFIYLTACQGLKSSRLADAFISRGAGAVVGWNETDCNGTPTGFKLIQQLLGGHNLIDSYSNLPIESLHDGCPTSTHADLTLYGSDTLRLIKKIPAAIYISSPQNDSSYTDRTLTLSGYFINGRISNGTVELNGLTTVLTKSTTDDSSFSQLISIKDSTNTLRIICSGYIRNDAAPAGLELVTVDTTITFKGDFPPLDLWTAMRWNTNNTDVDLHLLPPMATISDLWTDIDCYYGNRNTTWGGSLDVDNTVGYGPEHITIPLVTVEGDYTLYIHYYNSNGNGPTNVYVDVATFTNQTQHFGPYELDNSSGANNKGDLYAVCTISFPSGIVTPLNQYHYLGKLANNVHIKKK